MNYYEQFLENSIKDATRQIKELSDIIEKYKIAIHDISPWLSASLNNKCCQEYIDHCDNIFKLDEIEY
jgi:hypothetical protein